MAMIATDELTNGQLIDLPAAAGDLTQPRFEPVDDWLRGAPELEQKTAMWRWFATRYEEMELNTPHDEEGNFLIGEKKPVKADEVLAERFGAVVPAPVLQSLVQTLKDKVGNRWAVMPLDKVGS
ncbi:hypothetical protein RD110_00130 [Rhodoferax koreense]|uniref:Uncharacterized protein n=1 Tax=Rhodoferax koreensis TaxID=1842727 RepID=A0A1P8JQ01_9BURK|nr:hypothetical protein [Rhodoferax koreense]APW35818.1 hypothetical protein RD110_00130 [Rhodoferax koreense]